MSFKLNSLYLSDGYKTSHKRMLAPRTTKLYGTWIPRSIKYAPTGITKIVSFGQQMVWRWIHDEYKENFFMKEEMNLHLNNSFRKEGETVEDKIQEVKQIYKTKALQFAKDMSLYLGMEYDGEHFGQLWDLGYLPIRAKALPEGIETNPNIPHMTFVNTVDGFAWLPLYLETLVSSLSWKPATSATIALQYRRNFVKWVMKTDPENAWLIDYLGHDFSARGLSPWDMISSGLGHATSFRGSDTLAVIPAARYFYNEPENEVVINSVNASEHSVSTTKIFTVGEQQMLSDWMKDFPNGILSVVSDTFDLWKLITEYLPALKEQIMSRNGKLVIRPDSGDPVDIICGKLPDYLDFDNLDENFDWESFSHFIYENYSENIEDKLVKLNNNIYKLGDYKYYVQEYGWENGLSEIINDVKTLEENRLLEKTELPDINVNESKGVIELLWDIFGGTINKKGYKVLDPHIGAIYGDSITLERQEAIFQRLAIKGFASTNIVLGIGSFTYQYNTRDTFGFAAKGAWFEVKEPNLDKNGDADGLVKKAYNIYKDPVTDDGTKKSLKGLQAVFQTENPHVEENGQIWVQSECTPEEENTGLLQVIYEDGKFYNQTTLTEIRQRLKDL